MSTNGTAFLSGNEAIARGAWEAGVTFATGYPGTPSTEILQNLSRYPGVDAHWATNEKVAFEEAMGVAVAGKRALVTMKHVGLNVASDSFMVFPYAGTNGGFVVVSADDPGMHSSQNEQDNRNLARMARVPVIEPADPQECKDFLVTAFEVSERFGTPVMFRTTTRSAHSKGVVHPGERVEAEPVPFALDAHRFSVPIYRQVLRPGVEERLARVAEYAATTPLNRFEDTGQPLGVIANGISRQYAREAWPDADLVELGMTYPLPLPHLADFCATHEQVYVVEEGDPFIEEQLRAAGAWNVVGKDLFGVIGEYSPQRLRQAVGASGNGTAAAPALVPRPPMFCIGCGHRTVFDVLSQLRVTVAGDIGCYTMGALPPYEAEHTTFCMGASIGTAIGLQRAGVPRTVAVIGDSTFLHSGLAGIVDAVYTRTPISLLILNNSTTAMTGQQPHPGTGHALDGSEAPQVDLARVVAALGVEHVERVDAWDRKALRKAVLGAMTFDGPAVVIAEGPCQLLPEMRHRDLVPLEVVPELCTECDACYRSHCPAITPGASGLPEIDPATCVACNVCMEYCLPGAIRPMAAVGGVS